MRPLPDLSLFERQGSRTVERTATSLIAGSGTQTDSFVLSVPGHLLQSELLSCRYLGKSRLCSHFFQRRRNQQFLSLEYIYSGEICIRSGNKAYIAEAGDLCLLHPHCDNDLLYRPGIECRKAGLIPIGTLLPEIMKALHLDRINTIRMDSALWNSSFERIKDNLRKIMDPAAKRKLSGEMFELLNLMADLLRTSPVPPETAEIQAWLDEHFAEPLRMEQLAAKYGMSLPTFNNRFREAFNMTPYQYLIQTRLLYAARLLGESSLTIKEICSQSGYGSPFHFSAEFSRFYGCSPREFRRKNREF